jgi:hypothetical protein
MVAANICCPLRGRLLPAISCSITGQDSITEWRQGGPVITCLSAPVKHLPHSQSAAHGRYFQATTQAGHLPAAALVGMREVRNAHAAAARL